MSVDWIITLWYMALWIITNKKSQNPCWCCFISISFPSLTVVRHAACLIIVAVFFAPCWPWVFATPPELPGSTVACLTEGLGLMPVELSTGKGKARSGVQLKDATRCQKIMYLKKLPSTCQKAYIISPKTSQFHPHPGPTGVCPSWCCSAASMGGFNSLTR